MIMTNLQVENSGSDLVLVLRVGRIILPKKKKGKSVTYYQGCRSRLVVLLDASSSYYSSCPRPPTPRPRRQCRRPRRQCRRPPPPQCPPPCPSTTTRPRPTAPCPRPRTPTPTLKNQNTI